MMKLQDVIRRWRLAAPVAVLAAGVLGLGAWSVERPIAAPATVAAVAPAEAPLATASYADAVAQVLPAVVTVRVERRVDPMPAQVPDDPFFRRFFGPQFDREGPAPLQPGLGSGVILTGDGIIVTNNHVVDDAEYMTVTLSDGRQFTAEVVGTDAPTDLAVLRIDATGLPSATVADSDRVRVGDVVLAVGNPLGVGQTVTMGIISAKGRTTGLGTDGAYEDFLQTDAPINRGNSGGALITTGGELVGINTQILSPSGGSIGIGFAIPSNMVRHVMTQLVDTGRVRRGMIGVTVQPVTSDLARSLELDSVHGAIVASVSDEGPAKKAGIQSGDVILRVDGRGVNNSNDLRNRISSRTPGTSVTLDLVRDGRERQVTVTLAEMPVDETPVGERPAEGGSLGMSLEPVTPELARRLRLSRGATGVAVTAVQPGSTAARAGLQTGDVIRTVNGQDVKTPAEVREALDRRNDRPDLVVVERGGQPLFLAVPNR